MIPGWTCPFCGDPGADPRFCACCRRDPSAARRVCPGCRRMSPKTEPRCCHCQRAFVNELSWKIPLVVAVIVAATVLQFVLRSIH